MAIFNGNRVFSQKKELSDPIVLVPKSVKESLNVDTIYQSGMFKLEAKKSQALYDRCYVFEDINYVNQNRAEQKKILQNYMLFLNSMDVHFKICMINQFQDVDEFFAMLRSERNKDQYPEIVEGIHRWQEDHLQDANPSIAKLCCLVVSCRADSEESARIYFNALEANLFSMFSSWGSRMERMTAVDRIRLLQAVIQPGKVQEQEYLTYPELKKRDWKNDILPRSMEQWKNFMLMGDTYTSVLYGSRFKKSIDTDTFLYSLTELPYPVVVTLDYAPVETDVINDKLAAAQMNVDKNISDEIDEKQNRGRFVVRPSYAKEKKQKEIVNYMKRVDQNDEKGYFLNLLIQVTADSEELLAKRIQEIQAIGKKEGCVFETCDWKQLKAWNTVLPIGGRQVDYMRFFLTSSLVAFQPYHAQDVIEPGGQMLGINRITQHYILGNRKNLPNPHAIVIGPSGAGKSMFIKLTEIAQSLVMTDDDILIIDPQNEFEGVCHMYGGVYYDLTPQSGIYLNGFQISEEVFKSSKQVQQLFIAKQAEYAKTICAASMRQIQVTQEHNSVISRCAERMFEQAFAQKRLKRQPTLAWLREEIRKELDAVDNKHDEDIIRQIYNCLAEYTEGSCDMLARPSNIEINNRLVGFGMSNVSENNWEAVMVTILHYLSIRMDYNQTLQKATRLIVDETQVVSEKPGSIKQLNDAVITFRKFGGIVTMAMQNISKVLANQKLMEIYQNCSYKCFFTQDGVDAQSLASVQPLSTKDYHMLTSGKEGEGIIVWDKKVIPFSARIEKDNPLYEPYNTNFHEKAKRKEEQIRMEAERKKQMETGVPQKKRKQEVEAVSGYGKILQLAELTEICGKDVENLLHLSAQQAEQILKKMKEEQLLIESPDKNGFYRKAGGYA